MLMLAAIILAAVFSAVFFVIMPLSFRVVVPTNEMHIVQRGRTTVSYGKDQPKGNVYYRWPSWVPFIGLRVIVLPVSVFAQNLNDYAAYDKGRVPFLLDIIGFFRITDSNVAAQRVADMKQLVGQLDFILKGAIRTILASSEIEEILEGRSKFGEMFTKEVDEQLKQWGVQTVKCIELVDIRDANDSKVIANIMAKKKSLIESQSRIAVATNIQAAQIAEVEAKQAVEIRQREAEELVGKRAAERDQAIGIAQQKAQQQIKAEERETAARDMAVREVQTVRAAEIARASLVVTADQSRQQVLIGADAEKQHTVLVAEGALAAAKLHAEGVEAEGKARGVAETAVLMAPVTAQTALAKEIGSNVGYQTYLVSVRQIEATQAVGVEQAKALEQADVKVIVTGGNSPSEGLSGVMDLFTARGGTQLGAMLEGLRNTEAGAAILKRATNGAAKAD